MSKLVQALSLDLRSLAISRMGIALLIIFDLITRFGDLAAHYTDRGILPRNAVQKIASGFWTIYPHFAGGELWFQGLLFIVAAVFAMLLLLGYKTGFATVISWFLLTSLHTRNPTIINAGDVLLRLILFWGIFLPWGKRFSLDAFSGSRVVSERNMIFSSATLAYILQMVIMYWMSVLLKSGPEWRVEGSALYYALNSDQLATQLGSYLLNFPYLLKWLTFSFLILQAIAPFLILSPLFTNVLRMSAVFSLVLMHAVNALILSIGNFPAIAIVALVGLLPSGFWNSRDFFRFSFNKILGCVKFLPRDEQPEHAQTSYHLNVALSTAGTDASQTANENVFSRRLATLFAADGGWRRSRGMNVLVALLLLYVIFWNIGSMPGKWGWLPEKIRFIGYILRLDQTWDSFAPSPSKNDGWYVMPGLLQNGEVVNIFSSVVPHGGSDMEEENITYHLGNVRWIKYFYLNYPRDQNLRPYFENYACTLWNNSHEPRERLKDFYVYFVREKTLPNYQAPSRERFFMWKYYCI